MKKITLANTAFRLIMIALLTVVVSTEARLQNKNRKKSNLPTYELLKTNPSANGTSIRLEFEKGKSYNHPVMAVWVEDMQGNYIQTIYVVNSIAKSVFKHGKPVWGGWSSGVARRAATLPYWAFKRGIRESDGLMLPSPDNQLPDAISGATPVNNFILNAKTDAPLRFPFRVMLEINQPFDWNQFWHNNRYPDDKDYKTNGQPALVYEAAVSSPGNKTEMKPIGHSHYSGKDGSLTPDIKTLTTAISIVSKIGVEAN